MARKLADQEWLDTSLDEVVAGFLMGERDRFQRYFELTATDRGLLNRLICEADLESRAENLLRKSLLALIRNGLFHHVPPDTKWYRVQLRSEHLDELQVIGRCGWDAPTDRNELQRVAARWPGLELRHPPSEWPPPVLWGHGNDGPFVILEGNHRLVAYAKGPETHTLNARAYVGLSPCPCNWYLSDPRHLGYPREPLLLRRDDGAFLSTGLEMPAHMGF